MSRSDRTKDEARVWWTGRCPRCLSVMKRVDLAAFLSALGLKADVKMVAIRKRKAKGAGR